MYLIFPPEYAGLANAVRTQALQKYQYEVKPEVEAGLADFVGADSIVITTYDRDAAKAEDEVSEYRWSILKAMSQGAVFVHFDGVDEAHFFTPDATLSTEEQIEKILDAGRYAEARRNFFVKTSPKSLYVGPSYVNPLAVVVLNYDAKKEKFDVEFDPKAAKVLASLPEDLWTKTGFITARMSSTLHKLLDEFYDTAIVTLDKRVSKKVESYDYEQLAAPKNIDLEFGIMVNNKVKRKEVEEEG